MNLWARLAVLVLAFGALVCCSGRPKDPVEALLFDMEEAVEAKDAERLGEMLSPNFSGGPGAPSRADAIATSRRYFAAYEAISLTVYGVEIERQAGSATVRCVVEMSGQARKIGGLDGLLPPGAAYRFTLGVGEENGKWLVRTAEWKTADPPAPQ